MARRALVGMMAGMALWLGACGGDTPIQPTPPSTAPPQTQPIPAPQLPLPIAASPTPSPDCPATPCEIATTNTAPPIRLTLRLYTVEDPAGKFRSLPDAAEPIPLGWFARLDVTGKDADRLDTNGEVEPVWHFSQAGLIMVSSTHTHQRRLQVKEEGRVDCWVTQQGVTSNTITLRLAR